MSETYRAPAFADALPELSGRGATEERIAFLDEHSFVIIDDFVGSPWIEKLRDEFAGGFPGPGQITAFHKGFAVHGRFGLPCPDCGRKVQRIRYADNETNYCPVCQTGGRVLADRSLSRLLKNDWPRKPEDWG